ncbi:MAG: ABC transporter ATP-binding protein [Planctomycetes bacterium]|nr:ABC transporter ATP-binding protein [Planctomycetota bacterium]
MTDHILEVNRLSCSIEGKSILRDVSFEVDQGNFISIIGPNGAGKSTLLRCLLKILPDGLCAVHINRKLLANWRQKELARFAGYVPQMHLLPPAFTVGEFVLMARFPYQKSFSGYSHNDRHVADSAMATCGITDIRHRHLSTLSGGERQAAYIAAAIAQEGKLLILDEPTVFLDQPHQRDIFSLLKMLHADGMTIIMVTHDINSAVLASDMVLALSNGSVAFFGPGEELFTDDVLEKIYSRKMLFVREEETGKQLVAPAGWGADGH